MTLEEYSRHSMVRLVSFRNAQAALRSFLFVSTLRYLRSEKRELCGQSVVRSKQSVSRRISSLNRIVSRQRQKSLLCSSTIRVGFFWATRQQETMSSLRRRMFSSVLVARKRAVAPTCYENT